MNTVLFTFDVYCKGYVKVLWVLYENHYKNGERKKKKARKTRANLMGPKEFGHGWVLKHFPPLHHDEKCDSLNFYVGHWGITAISLWVAPFTEAPRGLDNDGEAVWCGQQSKCWWTAPEGQQGNALLCVFVLSGDYSANISFQKQTTIKSHSMWSAIAHKTKINNLTYPLHDKGYWNTISRRHRICVLTLARWPSRSVRVSSSFFQRFSSCHIRANPVICQLYDAQIDSHVKQHHNKCFYLFIAAALRTMTVQKNRNQRPLT